MIGARFLARETFDVPCTITAENSFESLHAHVELDGEVEICPGDEVTVHGERVLVPYGEKIKIRRTATVTRATPIERTWTRLTGDAEFMELLEFSFSEESEL